MSMISTAHSLSNETSSSLSTEELWILYTRTHSVEHRNELLLRYVDLVRRAVSRLYASAHHYHDYDDLLSCGVIGLMDAFERFDPARGIRFESYASVRIRGEIIDYMRRQDWAPVHLRLRLRQVENAVAQLSQTLGRSPTDPETADFLDMPLTDLQSLLGEAHWLNVVHLDDLLGGCPEENPALAQDAQFDQACEKAEMQNLLQTELGRLSEKEQRILSLYYEEELTLKEIGQILKLSESRISQIHSSTLLKLRTRLNQQPRGKPTPQLMVARRSS
jgi:RNA polymerase sigma factor FliA